MSKSFECKLAALGAATVLGLGTAACGSSHDSAPKPPSALEDPSKLPHVDVRYFPNGSRALDFVDANGTQVSHRILQMCMGGDIASITSIVYNDSVNFSLTPNSVCADGRLTPEDFPQEPNPAQVVK